MSILPRPTAVVAPSLPQPYLFSASSSSWQGGLSHGKVTRCLKNLFSIPLSRVGSVHTVLRGASRCAGAVGPDVGVADRLAERAFGRGLLESTPAGPAITRRRACWPQRLAGWLRRRARWNRVTDSVAGPTCPPFYT